MTKDEALKLALEALKELVAQTEARLFAVKHDHIVLQNSREAITAIKQALAQPEQEPDYAWQTVADYEKDVGFQVGEAFKMAWSMARTTNALFKEMENT